MNRKRMIALCILLMIGMTGCGNKNQDNQRTREMEQWVEEANLTGKESAEELYQAALGEDTLVIYSVSSRVFDVKESFEKEYPGLTVEVKDIRGQDLVNMLLTNYEEGNFDCDLVLCSDSDGSLQKKLLEPGLIYTYIPWDIESHMKEEHTEDALDIVGELLMLFYNENVFDESPIRNIWELTEEQYKGKIIMASPLSSFSTYGFCSTLLSESQKIAEAYETYSGDELQIPEGKTAGEVFWEQASENIVFTNSSDEVLEGIGGSGGDEYSIGIMISSKMRYQELGYHFAPIYQLNPFSAVYTPNSITIAGGSKNVNCAKLFIRYLLGETDGTGEGITPYMTRGTWSVRTDIPDANPVPLSDIDYIPMNKTYLFENRDAMNSFWQELLKRNGSE